VIAGAIYITCCLTSVTCALLLLRAYRGSRVRLLLWSGLCFVCLALNNIVLIIDLMILPEIDFSLYREIPALVGLMLLLFGMIWDADQE
jgi:hypothetical protein